MKKFEVTIHSQDISDIFWQHLASAWQSEIRCCLSTLDTDRLIAESLRKTAEYNTGSIPMSTAIALLILAADMQPERTFELGTFIGNSTRSLARHSQHVWTCDGQNDIGLGLPNVTQYRKTMSTDALQLYKDASVGPIDLMFLDGRLLEPDLPLVLELTNEDTVFALDDSYQLEKGMVNANALGQAFKDRPLFYLPPPRGEPFLAYGVPGHTTLSLMLHPKKLVLLKA